MYRHGQQEIEKVTEVIASGSWFRYYGTDRHGKTVTQLEKQLADFTGAGHVLATNSGTGALICSLAALGIGPGDEVIVPGYTFIASAAAVLAVGAVPVIVEIDETLTIDPKSIEAAISPRTRAVMPVHMLGYPSDMDTLMAIARKHDIKVVEDAAQAVGGEYKGRKLGAIGDMGCFSLQWHKIISTGEGGCVLTDDQTSYERAVIMHDDAHCFRAIDQGVPAFPGMNLRMSEVAGALGCAQINRLPSLIRDLRDTRRRMVETLGDIAPFRIAPSSDAAGIAGTNITLQAPDRETAQRFAGKTGMGSVLNTKATNWHIYYHWDYILEKRSANGKGWPWKFEGWESPVKYHKNMCPNTLDILQRSFNIGVNPEADTESIEKMTETITRGVREVG